MDQTEARAASEPTRSLSLIVGVLALLLQLGCYSVSYFPGGYQRQGRSSEQP